VVDDDRLELGGGLDEEIGVCVLTECGGLWSCCGGAEETDGRGTRSARSFAEASQRVSVFVRDEGGFGGDSVAMLPASHELADRSAGCVLHGDAFGLSALAERCVLAIGEAKCHGHKSDGISSKPC
jgi:hypothetical protein